MFYITLIIAIIISVRLAKNRYTINPHTGHRQGCTCDKCGQCKCFQAVSKEPERKTSLLEVICILTASAMLLAWTFAMFIAPFLHLL